MKNINKGIKSRSFTRIHLVRHAEVENPKHILYGRLPNFSISKKGFQMADALCEYILTDLKEDIETETRCEKFSVHEILSSPLLRTKQTAKPLADATKNKITPKGGLIEVDYYFEGERWGRVRDFFNPRVFRYFYNPFLPSWSESFNSINNRVKPVIIEKVLENRGHDTFMFSHKTVISTAVRYFLGKSLLHWVEDCDLASIHTLHFDENDKFLGFEYRKNIYKEAN